MTQNNGNSLHKSYAQLQQFRHSDLSSKIAAYATVPLLAVSLGGLGYTAYSGYNVYKQFNAIDYNTQPLHVNYDHIDQGFDHQSNMLKGLGITVGAAIVNPILRATSKKLRRSANWHKNQANQTYKKYVNGNPPSVNSKKDAKKLLALKQTFNVLGSERIQIPDELLTNRSMNRGR